MRMITPHYLRSARKIAESLSIDEAPKEPPHADNSADADQRDPDNHTDAGDNVLPPAGGLDVATAPDTGAKAKTADAAAGDGAAAGSGDDATGKPKGPAKVGPSKPAPPELHTMQYGGGSYGTVSSNSAKQSPSTSAAPVHLTSGERGNDDVSSSKTSSVGPDQAAESADQTEYETAAPSTTTINMTDQCMTNKDISTAQFSAPDPSLDDDPFRFMTCLVDMFERTLEKVLVALPRDHLESIGTGEIDASSLRDKIITDCLGPQLYYQLAPSAGARDTFGRLSEALTTKTLDDLAFGVTTIAGGRLVKVGREASGKAKVHFAAADVTCSDPVSALESDDVVPNESYVPYAGPPKVPDEPRVPAAAPADLRIPQVLSGDAKVAKTAFSTPRGEYGFEREVPYLGYLVGAHGVRPDPAIQDALSKMTSSAGAAATERAWKAASSKDMSRRSAADMLSRARVARGRYYAPSYEELSENELARLYGPRRPVESVAHVPPLIVSANRDAEGPRQVDASNGFYQMPLGEPPSPAPVKAEHPPPAVSTRADAEGGVVAKQLEALTSAIAVLAKSAGSRAAVDVDADADHNDDGSDGTNSSVVTLEELKGFRKRLPTGRRSKPVPSGGDGDDPSGDDSDGGDGSDRTPPPRPPRGPSGTPPEPHGTPSGAVHDTICSQSVKPAWYAEPGSDCDSPSMVKLVAWAMAVKRHTPVSQAQAKLFHKRSPEAILKFSDMLSGSVSNFAMYPHNRTGMVEQWTRTFLTNIFTQLTDGAEYCETVIFEAHFALHSQIESALRSAAQKVPTLNRLLVAFNNATSSTQQRLLQLLRALDSICLHHKAADAVHGEFYSLVPQLGETPLTFFDRAVSEGGIRGFEDRDIISLFNAVLRRGGDDHHDLVDLLDSSDSPMTNVSALRNRLARLNKASRPFKVKGGRRNDGSASDDAMLVVEVSADQDARDTHGQKVGTSSNTYVDVRDDSPAGTLKAAVEAARQINSSMQDHTRAATMLVDTLRSSRPTGNTTLPPPPPPVGGDVAFYANAGGGGLPPLKLGPIYEKLFAGKPVPTEKLVGHECAACAVDRPHIHTWVKWDEHPEWQPSKPGAKPNLPKGYGWCHNPAKCKCLYARVRQHVASHPEDVYLLEPAPPPPRAE